MPFLVCGIRPNAIGLLLANATFLKKISHSSHQLRVDNVRGSFLGHDIVREYAQLANAPENFEALVGMHLEFSWEENLARLVEATNAITSSAVRFEPSSEQTANVIRSAELAAWLTTQAEYGRLRDELNELVELNRQEILTAASIDNVKLRGDAIEGVLTRAGQVNNLEDFSRTLEIGPRVAIDIKTKILALASSPKAYNIEKFLRTLAAGSTVFDFFFVGIDVADQRLHTCLVSALDRTILAATRVQFHWAGRNSRGVTQLAGDLSRVFVPGFVEEIDVPQAQHFLDYLIALPVRSPAGDVG